MLEYYGSAPSVPPQIVVPRGVGDLSALAEFLSERRGSRVEVRAPERGEKRRLAGARRRERAARARRPTSQSPSRSGCAASRRSRSCARRSTSSALPLRIECYDISNIQGEAAVGSMVVFQDAVPKKSHYRKFGIAGCDGPGRLRGDGRGRSRAASRGSRGGRRDDYDDRFAAMPNLVVIDGGKGQLAAALAAMQAFDLPRVAVISLAKRVEEVFVPGRPDPIVLARHNPGLQLLQRIRDEAHRFALGFHRQRRDTQAFGSIFDELAGVGPARRKALLRHFGSADRVLAASPEELEGVPGVPAKTARAIYAQLHKAGAG